MNPQGDQSQWTLRMRDVCREAGVSRQVVHFYIQQGLLPAGRKTGRNMAYYGQVHVDRIQQIRRLQHERFLPLKVIKSLLERQDADYSLQQRAFLRDVRTTLGGGGTQGTVRVDDLLQSLPALSEAEIERLVENGMIGATTDDDGAMRVSQEAAGLLESLAGLRQAGLTEAAGFTVDNLAIFDDAITQLARREAAVFVHALEGRDPEEAAAIVEAVMPSIHALLVRLHRIRIDDLLSAL